MKRTFLFAATLIGLVALVPAPTASAHTETDFVAVPAAEPATIRLRPQHGCSGSPTVMVSVRAPVADAVAEAVDGWTATSGPDGRGNTVLEWTGGTLPPDEAGAFPVRFTVPDAVGELLTFPAVQLCENGEELAWISGDPSDEFPAPRLLVLAPGSAPAASIDDVAPDAPGRDQLVAIVDVDNPGATTTAATTVTAPTTETPDVTIGVPEVTAVTEPAPSIDEPLATGSAPVDTNESATSTDATGGQSDDGPPLIVMAIVVVAVAAVIAAVIARVRGGRASGSAAG